MSDSVEDEPSRKGGRIAAFFSLYAVRALGALWIAACVRRVAALTLGGYPDGDARLFEPGGVLLLEVVRAGRPFERALGLGVSAAIGVVAFAALLPVAMILIAAGRGRDLGARALFRASIEPFAALAWLEVAATFFVVVVAILIGMIGVTIRAQAGWTGPAEDLCFAVTAAIALGFIAVLGVVHDLARAVAVSDRSGVYASASHAITVFRRAPFRALGAWALRAFLATAVLASAALVATSIRAATATTIALCVAVHQLGVFVAVAWRASFLEVAVKLVATGGAPSARSSPA